MDGAGLEPARIAPPAPKAGASANFATRPRVRGALEGAGRGDFKPHLTGEAFWGLSGEGEGW